MTSTLLLLSALLASSCTAEPATPPAATTPPPASPAPTALVPASQAPPMRDVPYLQDSRLWTRGLRASSTGLDSPRIAVVGDGTIVVGITIGYAEGPADADLGGGVIPGVGKTDIVIGKFNPDDRHVWSRLFGGASTDHLGAIALAGDGSIAIPARSRASSTSGRGR